MTSKENKRNTQTLEKDYELIIKDTLTKVIPNKEWEKNGDVFTKFTLYQQYTPVKISCNTTLLNKL